MSESEDKDGADVTTRRPVISSKTVIPLGLAAILLVFVATSAYRLGIEIAKATYEQTATLREYGNELRAVRDSIASMEQRMTSESSKYVTREEMITFVELLSAKNASIVLPGVFTRKR